MVLTFCVLPGKALAGNELQVEVATFVLGGVDTGAQTTAFAL